MGGKSKTLVFKVLPDWIWNVCWLYVTELCKALYFPADILSVFMWKISTQKKKSLACSDLLKTEHQQITLWGKQFIFLLLTGYKFFHKRYLCLYFYKLKKVWLRGSLSITRTLSLYIAFVSPDFYKMIVAWKLSSIK